MFRAATMAAALAVIAMIGWGSARAAPSPGHIAKPRTVTSSVTATCKTWENIATVTVVCRDIPFENLAVGTCLSRACSADAGGMAKFEDGIYRGAFDGGMPGKGEGRLERNDGSVVEGYFRRGQMWQVSVYYPGGLMWKGDLRSETEGDAYGEWSVYRDEGSTRFSSPARYGSLFLPPTDAEVAAARRRLAGQAGAPPPPAKPGYDLTDRYRRSTATSAQTSGERLTCYALYQVLDEKVGVYGRLGLPEVLSPEAVAVKRKRWAAIIKADHPDRADLDGELANFRRYYDMGKLDDVADWAGSCAREPSKG